MLILILHRGEKSEKWMEFFYPRFKNKWLSSVDPSWLFVRCLKEKISAEFAATAVSEGQYQENINVDNFFDFGTSRSSEILNRVEMQTLLFYDAQNENKHFTQISRN